MSDRRVERSQRLRVALIFGGRSGEHDVSVVSARSVAGALDGDRYEVVPMAIDRHGRWADAEISNRVLRSSGDRTDAVIRFTGSAGLEPRLSDGGIDVAFPVLHGPFGEDGTIQGLFEMLDLPYVGCDHAASAVCMDKALTKRLVIQAGLPTVQWCDLTASRWRDDRSELRRRCLDLGSTLFVKPARLGSSVGISRVTRSSDLDAAIERALEHDDRIVVERGLDAREIEVAVLGSDHPRAAEPGEVIPGHDFYDYDDKYLDDSCQLLAPAPLESGQNQAVKRLAIDVFRTLGCHGMARVDLFIERPDGRVWVNEVNTIPGFTSISMYPRLWAVSGLDYPDLLDELVRLALERHRGRQKTVSS